jgi:hypothetical protein
LSRRGLHNPVFAPLLLAEYIENTVPFLLRVAPCYRAVACQRFDQICYNIHICDLLRAFYFGIVDNLRFNLFRRCVFLVQWASTNRPVILLLWNSVE